MSRHWLQDINQLLEPLKSQFPAGEKDDMPTDSFDKCECHKVMEGNCPVERLSIDEIKEIELEQTAFSQEWEECYCPFIAAKLLSDDPRHESFKHYRPCDGRHRQCVKDVLSTKGVGVTLYCDEA